MSVWLPHWLTRRANVGEGRRFGYAVVGLGHGAEKFCAALAGSHNTRVAALVSGTLAKATRTGRRYGVSATYTYEAFDDLATNSAVDAVYICLPNALHCRFAERAAAIGKHVLCEKPMAASADEARRMIDACRRANRLLMIGYRPDFDPAYAEARRLLASNALGEIRQVRSGFGFRAKAGWRLDPALAAGGSLYDVGIYSIHALHELFGEGLIINRATIIEDSATHLELEATWQATLRNGAAADCISSYLRLIPDHVNIEGERGTLSLAPVFAYRGTRLRARFTGPDGASRHVDISASRGGLSLFRLEAEHLAVCAQTGAPLRNPGESGLRDLQSLTRIETIAQRIQNTQ